MGCQVLTHHGVGLNPYQRQRPFLLSKHSWDPMEGVFTGKSGSGTPNLQSSVLTDAAHPWGWGVGAAGAHVKTLHAAQIYLGKKSHGRHTPVRSNHLQTGRCGWALSAASPTITSAVAATPPRFFFWRRHHWCQCRTENKDGRAKANTDSA